MRYNQPFPNRLRVSLSLGFIKIAASAFYRTLRKKPVARRVVSFAVALNLLVWPGPGLFARDFLDGASSALDMRFVAASYEAQAFRSFYNSLLSLFSANPRVRQKESTESRSLRVRSIELTPAKTVAYLNQRISFSAVGKDTFGNTVQGARHDADFRTVKFVTSKVGFIALYIAPKRAFQGDEDTTAKSYVLKTDDGGTTWRVIFGRTGFVFNSVEFVTSSEIWLILQAEETVLHTKDGGKSWSKVTTLPSFEVTNLYFADSENGWAVEGSGMFTNKVHYTNDGARSWAKSQLPEINKVDR